MSLTDVVRNLAKSVRDTFSDREKAKSLPFQMLQSALSGVGHALNLSDRLRKRLGGQEEEQAKRQSVDEQLAENAREAAKESGKTGEGESRAARREPVIFAPRPSPEEKDVTKTTAATAEPATEPAKAATPAAEATEPAAKPAEPVAEPAKPVAETTEPAAKPAEPVAEPAKPVAETTESVAKEEGELAKAAAATPSATESEAEAEAASKSEPDEPVATGPRDAEPGTEAKTEEKAEVAAEVKAATESATQAGPTVSETPALAEPIPGYANLSLASLRARLRNKSADDIRALIAYEKATTNRANIVKMYENRLAKITSAE